MTKGGFSAAVATAGAALVVLVFAGIVFVVFSAIYAGIAAVIAAVAVMIVESKSNWNITNGDGVSPFPLMLAFLISGGVAFALDLIFDTYVSMPAMIDALDLTRPEFARYVPVIENVIDYYAVALGPTPWTWLRFVGFYVVIVLVFAGVLIRIPAEPELEPDPPMKRNLKLLAVSAISVVSSAVTVLPLTTWAMIAWRNRITPGAP